MAFYVELVQFGAGSRSRTEHAKGEEKGEEGGVCLCQVGRAVLGQEAGWCEDKVRLTVGACKSLLAFKINCVYSNHRWIFFARVVDSLRIAEWHFGIKEMIRVRRK